MIVGHFGFAALVKARAPDVALWALMLATVWLDIVFVPLYLAGIESIDRIPGAAALALVFGCVAALAWGRRRGLILAAVVFSHWLLDLIVHRGDMPLLPQNAGALPMVGLGLWRMPVASMATEFALLAAGSFFYWRAACTVLERAGGRSRRIAHGAATLIFVAGCTVLYIDFTG